MLVKKMVGSKKIRVKNQTLFSFQLKKAVFYAFLEARKQGITTIDSQLLLYSLLKVNNTSVRYLFQKLYSSRSSSFNPVEKLLNKLKANLQLKKGDQFFTPDRSYPNFSRPVKRLLFFLLRTNRNTNKKISVVTTLHVLNYLLRHKSISKFVKETLLNRT